MAAKDNDIGTWSDWSVAVHATPWTEEPKHLTTEAQATGESPPSHYKQAVPAARGHPGVLAEGPPLSSFMRVSSPAKETSPPALRGAVALHPTLCPPPMASRCNHGPRGAGSKPGSRILLARMLGV